MPIERLQKVLAAAGIASRRHCEEIITQGRIAVNGVTVTQLGTKADPARDVISIDGRAIPPPQKYVYLILNKPPGYVTTASDEHGRSTVFEFVPPTTERVFPVGRLDKESEGLLLLTNDGALANRLMHPRYGLEREYHVWAQAEGPLGGGLDEDALAQLRGGTLIEGKHTEPVSVDVQSAHDQTERPVGTEGDGAPFLRFILKEGRKREVRALCAAAGLRVTKLLRVRYGPLMLGGLELGKTRRLNDRELRRLRRAVNLKAVREKTARPNRPTKQAANIRHS